MRGVCVSLRVVARLGLFEISEQLRCVRIAEDRQPRDDVEPVLGLEQRDRARHASGQEGVPGSVGTTGEVATVAFPLSISFKHRSRRSPSTRYSKTPGKT